MATMLRGAAMESFEVTPRQRLERRVDAEARILRVPPDHVIKGLFCQSLVDLLEDEWPAVRSRLLAPPDGGRYQPFRDYPQRDYCRIALAAAERTFPEDPLSEAARRLGRQDLTVFASSPMGRALFEPSAGLAEIFRRLPQLYGMVVDGGAIETRVLGERCAQVIFTDYHGWVDCYTVGTIEGIVQHYEGSPRIRVTLHSTVDAEYEVCWR